MVAKYSNVLNGVSQILSFLLEIDRSKRKATGKSKEKNGNDSIQFFLSHRRKKQFVKLVQNMHSDRNVLPIFQIKTSLIHRYFLLKIRCLPVHDQYCCQHQETSHRAMSKRRSDAVSDSESTDYEEPSRQAVVQGSKVNMSSSSKSLTCFRQSIDFDKRVYKRSTAPIEEEEEEKCNNS